jgi:hypothetical protein
MWLSLPLQTRPTGETGAAGRNWDIRLSICIRLLVLLGVVCGVATPPANAAKGVSRRVFLDGPDNMDAMPCDIVQVLGSKREPNAYFMDVDSVVCEEGKCEIVTVRLHFDPLGNYERYELPSGGNLTKWGHKPFSQGDHEKLHSILSDPYSPLKDVAWDQITMPKSAGDSGKNADGNSGATVLSKRNHVVVGAAYTCCTLWHWSHGETATAVRDMTIEASDRQDLIAYLQSEEDEFAEFALDQMLTQELFDVETATAVVQIMRHGREKLADPAFRYLEKASSETGSDWIFRCREDEYLVEDSSKRVQFLEALRDTDQEFPPGYLDRFGGWLTRADTYYEVHLLLTLMEREGVSSDETVNETMALLESDDSLVVRRSYKHLKGRKLKPSQLQRLEAFEGKNPNP